MEAPEDARAPVGLIAGGGRMPFLVADGVRRQGRRLVVAALGPWASPRLRGLADEFKWVGIARIGSWIRLFRRHGVRETVMIGSVRKSEVYSPLRLLRYIPDLRTMRIWYVRIHKDRRDNVVLRAVADELDREGIRMVSCMDYCQDHFADEGLMTRTRVPRWAEEDVEFGWNIARASADLDIGQSIAVKERDIIAVEAMEGTDAMVRRAGRVCRVGGWTMVKVARPRQDMRFDVPTIGPETIRNLKDAKCSCLLLEAGRTLIADKNATLELADRVGIAVLGRRSEAATSAPLEAAAPVEPKSS
jgi:DUF1009 family protein